VVVTSQLSLEQVATEPPAAKKRPPRARLTSAVLEATAQSASGNGWVLTLPDGSEIEVGLPVVIGRRPWTAEPDEREVVHVVAPSSKREISGIHLELSLSNGVVQARDLNSTNGTIVRTKSRPPRLLHSGGITELAAGDILDVGEDFSIALGDRD
jgi:pSer/pThr/pTyr-binding forkhead associated (FHA) protein